jgi:hypothetical protein
MFFVGGLLSIGLIWLLTVVYLAETLMSIRLEGISLGLTAVFCFALAVYPAWQFFVKDLPASDT